MFAIIERPGRGPVRRAKAFVLLAAAALAPAPLPAQTPRAEIEDVVRQYLEAHPEAIGPAITKYLTNHPEAVRDAIQALIAKRAETHTAAATAVKQTIADNADALYAASLQTALGDANGAPVVVEFFDFNCRYCRMALADTLSLLAEEPKLRIILKEFPILGQDSVEVAKVAIALQMQRPGAAASLEFHRRLLASQGRVDGAAALKIADQLGLDAAQLEKDAASVEVDKALQQNMRLASALGIRGTPAYVVGDSVISGAVGAASLKARLAPLKKSEDLSHTAR